MTLNYLIVSLSINKPYNYNPNNSFLHKNYNLHLDSLLRGQLDNVFFEVKIFLLLSFFTREFLF